MFGKIFSKKFTSILTGIILGILFLGITVPNLTLATPATGDSGQILDNLRQTGLGDTNQQEDLKVIIGKIIKVFLGFMGIVMVILIIYAGFLWMTAMGDEKKIDKAKEILKGAVIGVIIILVAYTITVYVVKRVGEATDSAAQTTRTP